MANTVGSKLPIFKEIVVITDSSKDRFLNFSYDFADDGTLCIFDRDHKHYYNWDKVVRFSVSEELTHDD